MLKPGDKVIFTDVINYEDVFRHDNYYTEEQGIPEDLIIHGQARFRTNEGEVVDFYGNYIIVKYIDVTNNVVQLGFEQNDIKNKISRKDRINNIYKEED